MAIAEEFRRNPSLLSRQFHKLPDSRTIRSGVGSTEHFRNGRRVENEPLVFLLSGCRSIFWRDPPRELRRESHINDERIRLLGSERLRVMVRRFLFSHWRQPPVPSPCLQWLPESPEPCSVRQPVASRS